MVSFRSPKRPKAMVQRELTTEVAAPAGKTPADTPAIYRALVEPAHRVG